jgi:hypothetical protein
MSGNHVIGSAIGTPDTAAALAGGLGEYRQTETTVVLCDATRCGSGSRKRAVFPCCPGRGGQRMTMSRITLSPIDTSR